MPGVRPVLLSDIVFEHLPGTGCARARAIAALSSERSVSPTVIVIGLALLVHSHRRAAQRKVKLLLAGGSDGLPIYALETGGKNTHQHRQAAGVLKSGNTDLIRAAVKKASPS